MRINLFSLIAMVAAGPYHENALIWVAPSTTTRKATPSHVLATAADLRLKRGQSLKAPPRKTSRFFLSKKRLQNRIMWSPPDSNLHKISWPLWRKLKTWREMKWGVWALLSLYISIISGVVVGLQYDFTTPFYSVSTIELIVPFGSLLRALHFYSSQIFFILSCIHLLAIYTKAHNYSRKEWIKLLATLPVILFLLFTGYVLRGDLTGSSAGAIAENILESVPVVGGILNSVFFAISENGLRKVYVQHVIGLDLVFLGLIWYHLRIYRHRILDNLPSLAALLILSMLLPAPLEPEQLGVEYIAGPWFFLGLQELLRYMSPLLAGVVIPSIFMVLFFRSHPAGKHVKSGNMLIFLWLCSYAFLSIIAWCR